MTKDYVAEAVARTLGVSVHAICGWELSAKRQGRALALGVGALGMIETRLQVSLAADSETLRKALVQDRRGSWLVGHYDVEAANSLSAKIRVDITLVRGKETQHIFKALHQTVTVRGPQKRKKKR
jgi:hypothetical protein